MSHKEFDGLVEEDIELFKKLITEFYKKPWEESYNLLCTDIENRFLRKSTNKRYKSLLINNMHDLVADVVSRFIKINRKVQQAGGIQHYYGMLDDRIKHVYHEELRRILKQSRSLDLDDPGVREQPASIDTIERELEEKEEREIKIRCYNKCLSELPKHILNIFIEYYGYEVLAPKERTEARLKLGLKVANISASEATPEQVKRAKNNLDSMISKWKRNHLEPCKNNCMKRNPSRH